MCVDFIEPYHGIIVAQQYVPSVNCVPCMLMVSGAPLPLPAPSNCTFSCCCSYAPISHGHQNLEVLAVTGLEHQKLFPVSSFMLFLRAQLLLHTQKSALIHKSRQLQQQYRQQKQGTLSFLPHHSRLLHLRLPDITQRDVSGRLSSCYTYSFDEQLCFAR